MDTLYFLRQINYNLVNILKSVTYQLGKKVSGLITGNFRFNRLFVSKYHFITPRSPPGSKLISQKFFNRLENEMRKKMEFCLLSIRTLIKIEKFENITL